MNYKNALEILPTHLLEEIRQYADGIYIYIPTSNGRKKWGSKSGARETLDARNLSIKKDYLDNYSLSELSQKYFLSESAIKKVVNGKK